MKYSKFLLFIIIFLAVINIGFALNQMEIGLSISNNDIVTEHIKLNIESDDTYDSIEYATNNKPLSVTYDGKYTIRSQGDTYIIDFNKDILVGDNKIEFTIIYDDMIEGSKNKIFRTSFFPEGMDNTLISLKLPPFYILSEKTPSATPMPDDIQSDGQHIYLTWNYQDQDKVDLAVFFQGQGRSLWFYIIPGFIIIGLIYLIVYYSFKIKTKSHMKDMLSSEEKKVIEELGSGELKQKTVSQNLGFSKSKMSKLIRKLEEKNLIEKKPHFKTNLLKLTRRIK